MKKRRIINSIAPQLRAVERMPRNENQAYWDRVESIRVTEEDARRTYEVLRKLGRWPDTSYTAWPFPTGNYGFAW